MQQNQPYIVSARKYRPTQWQEVVGQEGITDTLQNAIESGHLAQAYLFCGPRGVGKTTCARIFAREINRTDKTSPDEDFAFNIFELDAASNNSVEDIRSLTDQVRIPPQIGKYKVYIIDEVHMLSTSAFNAFLKTLEEPPRHAIFILATTEKHKIIPTILSRCQIYDFNRISVNEIATHLEGIAKREKVHAEPEALHLIGQKADGALRDALSIFDQLINFTRRNLTYDAVLKNLHILDYDYYFKLTDALAGQQYTDALLIFDEILKNGFDGHHFISGLASHLRDLLICKDARTATLLEVTETVQQQYAQQAAQIPLPWLLQSLNVCTKADIQYKTSANPRLLIEVSLLQMCFGTQEAEKKKPEPITRATGNGSPAKTAPVPVAAPPQQVVEPPTTQSPPMAQPASTPAPNTPRRRATLSIHGNGPAKVEEGPAEEKAIESREQFTIEDLKAVWKSFVEKATSDGKSSFAAILNRQELEMDENFGIKIHLLHEIEESEFTIEKGPLLEQLREQLKNGALHFKPVVKKQTEQKTIYTNKDKFEHFAKKNPKLLDLKNALDLDIPY